MALAKGRWNGFLCVCVCERACVCVCVLLLSFSATDSLACGGGEFLYSGKNKMVGEANDRLTHLYKHNPAQAHITSALPQIHNCKMSTPRNTKMANEKIERNYSSNESRRPIYQEKSINMEMAIKYSPFSFLFKYI